MSFGENLQFLRKIHGKMTQEDLAYRLKVSRQTISKWEMDSSFPEMENIIALCKLFHCSLDEIILGDINLDNEAYIDIRIETVPSFEYVKYAVISTDPENDAKNNMYNWSLSNGIKEPEIIGWDFPFVSQEQVNIHHMHGYVAASIIPNDFKGECANKVLQCNQKYGVITIKEPFKVPFTIIPNGYKALIRYIEVKGFHHKKSKEVLECFEREYLKEGISYMDIYIAIDN